VSPDRGETAIEADLEEMLRRGEGESIEFKKSFAEQEAAVRTIGALASQRGGAVVIGVSPQRRCRRCQCRLEYSRELRPRHPG
jgi:predicted HTH transcriptional regulator